MTIEAVRLRWEKTPHPFRGRLDQYCEFCQHPDRHRAHDGFRPEVGPGPFPLYPLRNGCETCRGCGHGKHGPLCSYAGPDSPCPCPYDCNLVQVYDVKLGEGLVKAQRYDAIMAKAESYGHTSAVGLIDALVGRCLILQQVITAAVADCDPCPFCHCWLPSTQQEDHAQTCIIRTLTAWDPLKPPTNPSGSPQEPPPAKNPAEDIGHYFQLRHTSLGPAPACVFCGRLESHPVHHDNLPRRIPIQTPETDRAELADIFRRANLSELDRRLTKLENQVSRIRDVIRIRL